MLRYYSDSKTTTLDIKISNFPFYHFVILVFQVSHMSHLSRGKKWMHVARSSFFVSKRRIEFFTTTMDFTKAKKWWKKCSFYSKVSGTKSTTYMGNSARHSLYSRVGMQTGGAAWLKKGRRELQVIKHPLSWMRESRLFWKAKGHSRVWLCKKIQYIHT